MPSGGSLRGAKGGDAGDGTGRSQIYYHSADITFYIQNREEKEKKKKTGVAEEEGTGKPFNTEDSSSSSTQPNY